MRYKYILLFTLYRRYLSRPSSAQELLQTSLALSVLFTAKSNHLAASKLRYCYTLFNILIVTTPNLKLLQGLLVLMQAFYSLNYKVYLT